VHAVTAMANLHYVPDKRGPFCPTLLFGAPSLELGSMGQIFFGHQDFWGKASDIFVSSFHLRLGDGI
jgi:hypothetical protein